MKTDANFSARKRREQVVDTDINPYNICMYVFHARMHGRVTIEQFENEKIK